MSAPRVWTPEEDRNLIAMRERGLSYYTIARTMRIAQATVSTRGGLLGIPGRMTVVPPVQPAREACHHCAVRLDAAIELACSVCRRARQFAA